MKLSVVFLFASFIFCSACSSSLPDCQIVKNSAVRAYSADLKKKEGFILTGEGGSLFENGKFTDTYTCIAADYDYYKKIDIDEARRLIIRVSDGLLRAINNSEELRPYLISHPFTIERLEVSIIFLDSKGRWYAPPSVGSVHIGRTFKGTHRIGYFFFDNEKGVLDELDKFEPYEEALRILREGS